jgi:hypothetical protein
VCHEIRCLSAKSFEKEAKSIGRAPRAHKPSVVALRHRTSAITAMQEEEGDDEREGGGGAGRGVI